MTMETTGGCTCLEWLNDWSSGQVEHLLHIGWECMCAHKCCLIVEHFDNPNERLVLYDSIRSSTWCHPFDEEQTKTLRGIWTTIGVVLNNIDLVGRSRRAGTDMFGEVACWRLIMSPWTADGRISGDYVNLHSMRRGINQLPLANKLVHNHICSLWRCSYYLRWKDEVIVNGGHPGLHTFS